MTNYIRVQKSHFNLDEEIARARGANKAIGALVSFTGFCRDEDGTIDSLELEHYPEMAEKQLTEIALNAAERWPLISASIIHRYGLILAGEEIVLVIATSAHRQAAFSAANFMMDFLKTDAPFWKKEHRQDHQHAEWIQSKITDTDQRNAWLKKP